MSPLFKWQLLGDFVRLGAMVMGYQFLAKRMVKNFIFTEILSLGLFYGFAYYLTGIYGVSGVVMAHFFRYIIYFFVVFYLVFRYFRRRGGKPEVVENERKKQADAESKIRYGFLQHASHLAKLR